MTERKYLCSVVGNGGHGVLGETFRSSISDLLQDLRMSWDNLDLRTLEEQNAGLAGETTGTGQMLVTVDDASPFVHTEIMKGGNAVVFTQTSSKASLVARIGSEAQNELYETGKAQEFLQRVHGKRRERYLRERVVVPH